MDIGRRLHIPISLRTRAKPEIEFLPPTVPPLFATTVVPGEGNPCSSGLETEQILRDAGHAVEYAFQSDDNGTLQGLVAAGFGAALVPLLAVSPGDDRVRVMELEPAVPPRVLAVVWHRDRHRSPAAKAFVEIARRVSAEVETQLVAP